MKTLILFFIFLGFSLNAFADLENGTYTCTGQLGNVNTYVLTDNAIVSINEYGFVEKALTIDEEFNFDWIENLHERYLVIRTTSYILINIQTKGIANISASYTTAMLEEIGIDDYRMSLENTYIDLTDQSGISTFNEVLKCTVQIN